MDRVIKGLVEKRAELSGELERSREHASILEQQIAHLDGALAVLGYDHGRMPIKPTYKRKAGYFARSELTRMVLDILRQHGACTAVQVRDFVMERKGIPAENAVARSDIHHHVGKALRRQAARGLVRSVVEAGELMKWEGVA